MTLGEAGSFNTDTSGCRYNDVSFPALPYMGEFFYSSQIEKFEQVKKSLHKLSNLKKKTRLAVLSRSILCRLSDKSKIGSNFDESNYKQIKLV